MHPIRLIDPTNPIWQLDFQSPEIPRSVYVQAGKGRAAVYVPCKPDSGQAPYSEGAGPYEYRFAGYKAGHFAGAGVALDKGHAFCGYGSDLSYAATYPARFVGPSYHWSTTVLLPLPGTVIMGVIGYLRSRPTHVTWYVRWGSGEYKRVLDQRIDGLAGLTAACAEWDVIYWHPASGVGYVYVPFGYVPGGEWEESL